MGVADTNVKLTQLLCRTESCINDQEYKYFLITDKPKKETLNDEDSLKWVSEIQWQAVFDFDEDSFSTGIGSKISQEMFKKPKTYQVGEIAELLEKESDEYVRKEISLGQRSVWFFCDKKDQNFKDWTWKQQAKISC